MPSLCPGGTPGSSHVRGAPLVLQTGTLRQEGQRLLEAAVLDVSEAGSLPAPEDQLVGLLGAAPSLKGGVHKWSLCVCWSVFTAACSSQKTEGKWEGLAGQLSG